MSVNKKSPSRRNFLKQITGTTLALGQAHWLLLRQKKKLKNESSNIKKISSNDRINIAVIGMGIMGNNNVNTALKVPGVQLVAACDLYTGRLEQAKELHGKDLFVTNDYRKILDGKI